MDEFELYLNGMSIPEVSEKTGIPRSTLRSRFFKKGILRTRGDGVRNAVTRGRHSVEGAPGKRSKETKDRIKAAREKHSAENAIGFRFTSNGYMEFTKGPYKGRLFHDVIMEKHIGRKLRKNELVHHKDGVKCNNHPSNLELLTRAEHSCRHALEAKVNRNENGQFI